METITINGQEYNLNVEQLIAQGLIAPVKKEIEYIDLGLPSGTLWATENADGMYYTFDEAVEKFGEQLPTMAQFCELKDCCDYHFDNKTKEGVFSRNGKELRFPASGYLRAESGAFGNVGSYGLYWGCKPYNASLAYTLYFYSDGVTPSSNFSRAAGFPVRCVKTNIK